MRLVLDARHAPTGASVGRREVAAGSFRIGRGSESDWVLVDPERVLSKFHCQLVGDVDGWTLADTSSNGTWLNGSRLEPAARVPVRPGDRLVIGSYEIEVSAAADADGIVFGRPETERASTEDPFPFPGTDEFGFLLRAADPRASFEPIGLDAEVPGHVSELGADRVSDLHEHIRLPRPMGELLPEDWDAPAPGGGTPPPAPGPMVETFTPEAAEDLPLPRPEPAAVPPRPETTDALADILTASGAAQTTIAASPAPDLPPIAPPPVPAPGSAAGAEAGFAAFAQGAGLGGATVADPLAALGALGQAFHALVHELRKTMMARAAIKAEFRIEQTMIRPSGNNPLKFAVDDADALSALLGTGRRSGLTPAEAVTGALRDMRLHELAVMSAMQHAVRDVLAEFAPERIEEEAGAATLDALAGRRATRLWRAFQLRHERLSRTLEDDFDSAFGRAFVRAYEVALREAEEAGGETQP